MSLITFDYRCTQCGYEDTRYVQRNMQDFQIHQPECGGRMKKLPPNTRTTFRFADTKLKD